MTKTPLTLITGTLGSGKTTLLRRILERTGRRIAVLMNEFGEIAIDSKVIQGEHVEIVELGGGCVCCSLTGEFEAAINEILDKVGPELIVVETTGVAEADALVFEIEGLPRVRLDAVLCLVDADATVRFPQIGYTMRGQLEAADIILLNKVDLVTPAQKEEVKGKVRQFNDRAALFETVRCEVDTELLFGPDVARRPAPAEHHHDQEFQSFTFTTDGPLDRERFGEAVGALPPSVYRSKGFVLFPEGSYLFNYVAGRWDLEEFVARRTELVFIGKGLLADRESILRSFQECEV